jgi:hypothetical protein
MGLRVKMFSCEGRQNERAFLVSTRVESVGDSAAQAQQRVMHCWADLEKGLSVQECCM